jgi:hypothetical protein
MRTARLIVLHFFSLAVISSQILLAQESTAKSPWEEWKFLLGEWFGEGGGKPGEGVGWFSFSPDLQGTVLLRKNHSDFPATKDRPAFSHDDLMVIYREPAGATKAAYFDNEGHVIQYTVTFSSDSNSVGFLSEPAQGAPQFRLVYDKLAAGQVKIRFEIAPPGEPRKFTQYLAAVAHRK